VIPPGTVWAAVGMLAAVFVYAGALDAATWLAVARRRRQDRRAGLAATLKTISENGEAK
jgi:hypothetical protein